MSKGAALWSELLAAIALLTRIPVRLSVLPRADRCVWAYPVVGAAIGGFGAVVQAGLARAGAPPLLAALWTVVALIVVTGALHEDGLADCADALGGTSRDARMRIMRDSRIGSFGVLALVLAMGIRVAAVASLDGRAAAALIVAGALSRAAILGVLLLAGPARAEGLGAALRRPVRGCVAGLALALLSLVPLPPAAGIAAWVAAALAALLVATAARRLIGGQTGDVLGAAAQLAECAVLTVLAA